MRLLAIDTATELCAVALTKGPELVAEYRLNRKNMHNEKLVQAVQQIAADADWPLNTLDGIAVSIGPGSFTGLRIGLSVVKGLAFSLDVPVAAVNTLDALAFGNYFWSGQVCAVIKARQEELYVARYDNGDPFRRISDYEIITNSEFGELLQKPALVVPNPVRLVDVLQSSHALFAPPAASLASAFKIAQLGYEKFLAKEIEDAEMLEPFYLKEFQPKKKRDYAESGH